MRRIRIQEKPGSLKSGRGHTVGLRMRMSERSVDTAEFKVALVKCLGRWGTEWGGSQG